MRKIGFATQYYTLWDVRSEDIFSTIIGANGENHYKSGERYIYTYIKNISKDLDKVVELYPDTPIDEDLRGVSRSFEYVSKTEWDTDVFSKGWRRGEPIALCEDIVSLKWSYDRESSEEVKSNIKSRLLELGLVEFENDLYDNQKQVNDILEKRRRVEDLRLKSRGIYNKLSKGGTIKINFKRNLSADGRYYDEEKGVSILFKDFKVMYYRDLAYSLPVKGGVGKRIKNKEVELVGETREDIWSEYGGKVILVSEIKRIV